MRRIVRGTWMVMVGLLVLASASWGEPGVTDTDIVIGSCSALEGPAGFLGTQTVLGAKVYVNMVNEQGGVHGRKIKLVAYDDGYEPNMTINCVNQLVQKDNVFALGFFVGTPTGVKAVPMAEAHKVPILGFFTGAEILRAPVKHHVIHVRASYYDEARTQVDNLVNGLGMKKIAVFYQEDAFGLAVLEGVKIALKKHDMAPVALGTFPRNTLEIAKGMEQVKLANVGALAIGQTFPTRPKASQ